ncbi:MAG: DUF3187 family protein [Spirochaetota bacterium]
MCFPLSLTAFIDFPYGVTFQTIRTPLLPLDNQHPGEDNFFLRANLQWMNVWSIQDNQFTIDGEEIQIEPHFRYAVSKTMQLGFSLPLVSRGGGILDFSIEKFHNYTGVTNAQRDRYKRNTFNVSYEPLGQYYLLFDPNLEAYYLRVTQERIYPRKSYDPPVAVKFLNGQVQRALVELYFPYLYPNDTEEIVISGEQTMGPSNPRVFVEQDFRLRGFFSRVKLGMQYRLPIPAPTLAANPGFDTSLFVVLQRELIPRLLNARLGIAYNWYQVKQYRFLRLRGEQSVWRPALDLHWQHWMFSAEYVFYSSPILDFGRLSEPTHQIAFVINYRKEDTQASFAVIENFLTYAATPDIGFHFSYERRFRF